MLLTLAEQQAIRPISPNWAKSVAVTGGVSNYEQLVTEVEESDLEKLIGAALLQDIQDNPTEARNITLLSGGTFENCNGDTVKFKGIKYILAYMNYSQYVTESFAKETFSGLVKKERNEASSLSSAERKEIKINARDKAMYQFDLLKQFLNDNTDTYDFWYSGQMKVPYAPRIRGFRKTRNR